MELTSPLLNTLKISTKKGYILFNPDVAEDAKIVIVDDNADFNTNSEGVLVIYGPGEYEASGIHVAGTRPEDDTVYSVDMGEGRMLHALSTSVSKLADEDEFEVVAIRAVSPVNEAGLASLASKLVVVYGDPANIPDNIKANSLNKINLKKRDEIQSNIVYLEKK